MAKKQRSSDTTSTQSPGNRSKLLWGLAFGALLSGLTGAAVALFLGANGKPLPTVTLDRPLTILVLGIDNSGHPHSNHSQTLVQALAGNSDTMLLVRLLPKTHQINVLSIPRDTLVQLPTGGVAKVNDANMQGGATLAVQTVSRLLGNIAIDRYIRVDTEGLIQLVDALGGVTVTIPKPMDYVDHTQRLNIHFLAGQQTLNGQHLQEYVRFRHDALGDIGRVQRQQTVLKALLQHLWEPSTLFRLPQLLQVVQQNVDSDLQPSELVGIAQFLSTMERRQLSLVMLPGRFSRPDEFPASYWLADVDAAAPILTRYFDVPTTPSAVAQGGLTIAHLKVAIINETNQPALGTQTLALLRQAGFANSYLSDPDSTTFSQPQPETQIIAQHGNPEEASAVIRVLGLGQVAVESTGDLEADLTVKLGTDWATRLHPKSLLTH